MVKCACNAGFYGAGAIIFIRKCDRECACVGFLGIRTRMMEAVSRWGEELKLLKESPYLFSSEGGKNEA
jgi:hypothetical protein